MSIVRWRTGRVREAYRDHVALGFRHHNPYFAGDAQSLQAGMEENARQFPGKEIEILRAMGEGDLVAVHARVRMKPEDPWIALVHIFRFDGDRIAELWDVSQAAPAASPNVHGMF